MFFSLFKGKNWRETSQNICFTIFYIKNLLWKIKKTYTFYFEIHVLQLFFYVCISKVYKHFKKKFFEVPVIFWKWKLCQACVAQAEITDFLELNS